VARRVGRTSFLLAIVHDLSEPAGTSLTSAPILLQKKESAVVFKDYLKLNVYSTSIFVEG
jgi:hypothetical protein